MSDALTTGCQSLDDLLGGGFERGTVTQLDGPPAAGKTNVALSAAVNVAAGGGTAVYIDTEGLSPDRFRQLAAAAAGDDTDELRAEIESLEERIDELTSFKPGQAFHGDSTAIDTE